jgi:hypothetical protein
MKFRPDRSDMFSPQRLESLKVLLSNPRSIEGAPCWAVFFGAQTAGCGQATRLMIAAILSREMARRLPCAAPIDTLPQASLSAVFMIRFSISERAYQRRDSSSYELEVWAGLITQ